MRFALPIVAILALAGAFGLRNHHLAPTNSRISGSGVGSGGEEVISTSNLATSFPVGGVIFSDGAKEQVDANNFYWDDTNDRLGLATTTPGGRLSIRGSLIQTGGPVELLSVRATNILATSTVINSGIGTSTPGALFSVHGPVLINGTTTIIGGLLTPSISATDSLGIYTNSVAAPRFVINSAGSVGIGTTSPSVVALSVHGNSLFHGTSTFTGGILSPGIYSTSSIGFYNTSIAAPILTVGQNGTSTVAIGTTTPSTANVATVASLIVQGTVIVKGQVHVDPVKYGNIGALWSVDCTQGDFHVGILNANTSMTLRNCFEGDKLWFTVTQDGTGGWIIVWPSGALTGSSSPTATANRTSWFGGRIVNGVLNIIASTTNRDTTSP